MNRYNYYMIIVPHPDDDISIAGPLIYELKKLEKKLKVVFVTNGDNIIYEGKIRLKESIKALRILGVKQNDIIFLGYPDNSWNGRHIYNYDDDEIVVAANGRTLTSGLQNNQDFSYKIRGYHNSFSRGNIKKDIQEVITENYPEVVIVNDYDNHPDHKAVSLLFDEVMGDILKKNKDYKPIILKKFAYNGVWHGKDDYYIRPIQETLNDLYEDKLEVPYFRWSDRIKYYALPETMTTYLKDNIIYKSLKKYKIELGFVMGGCVCSRDAVYWQRRSDNLCLNAHIEVSSGEKKYINDFKYIDCSDLYKDQYDFSKYIWNPTDDKKIMKIELDKPSYIGQISIYESSSTCDNIFNVHIVFDNNITFDSGELKHDGSESRFLFSNKIYTKNLKVSIDKFEGNHCGFSELELYENLYEESSQNIEFEYREYDNKKPNYFLVNIGYVYRCIEYLVVKSLRKFFRIAFDILFRSKLL